MIYIGFLLITVAAGLWLLEKTDGIRRAVREYSRTLALLVYLKGAALAERKTPAEAFLSFAKRTDSADIPWLSLLSDEGRVNSFLREKGLLSAATQLSAEDKNALGDFFFDLGKHTAEEEKLRIDRIIGAFEKAERERCSSAEKNIKAAWVLFVTAVIGIFILLI